MDSKFIHNSNSTKVLEANNNNNDTYNSLSQNSSLEDVSGIPSATRLTSKKQRSTNKSCRSRVDLKHGDLAMSEAWCIQPSKKYVNKNFWNGENSECNSRTQMSDETDAILESCEEDFHLQQKAMEKFQDLSKRLQNLLLTSTYKFPDTVSPIKRIHEISGISGKSLYQLAERCIYIVDSLHMVQQKQSTSCLESTKLQELESTNKMLQEQLETSRAIQKTLSKEMKYLEKEKNLLREEVKQLSLQIASDSVCRLADPGTNNSSSLLKSGEQSCEDCVEIQTPLVEKDRRKSREKDFDVIMNCFKERGGVMDSLQEQMKTYYSEVKDFQKFVQIFNDERKQLFQDLSKLAQDYKILLRERDHYETMLKLILREKVCEPENAYELLNALMNKLNNISSNCMGDSNGVVDAAMMEAALETMQDQNYSYREQISMLTDELQSFQDSKNNELLEKYNEVCCQLESMQKDFFSNEKMLNEVMKTLEEKEFLVEKLEEQIKSTQTNKNDTNSELESLREALKDAEEEKKEQKLEIEKLTKVIDEHVTEIEGYKKNVEHLSTVISEQKSTIKGQRSHWMERIKSIKEEMALNKDHVHWLQSQVEHLNKQLVDANERIKTHEKEKSNLQQQINSADEERKVIDRKLHELRSALQGDSVLREALVERNEALQIEINRLRRARLLSLANDESVNLTNGNITDKNTQGVHFDFPPSEKGTMDGLSSLHSIPSAKERNQAGDTDKMIAKKNRYTAAYRRGNEMPARSVVSLHNGTVSTSK